MVMICKFGMQGRTVGGVSVEQLSLVPRLVLVSAALIDTSTYLGMTRIKLEHLYNLLSSIFLSGGGVEDQDQNQDADMHLFLDLVVRVVDE